MKRTIAFLVIFAALQSCYKENTKTMEQPVESVITEQDINYLQSLSPKLLASIDGIIYGNTSEKGQKIAMVLSRSYNEIKILDPNITYEQLLSRLHSMIKSGKLASRGNINVMRFSEVKRT